MLALSLTANAGMPNEARHFLVTKDVDVVVIKEPCKTMTPQEGIQLYTAYATDTANNRHASGCAALDMIKVADGSEKEAVIIELQDIDTKEYFQLILDFSLFEPVPNL